MLARVPWFKVSQSNASARWCPSCHPCSRQCRSTEEIISKARPILEAGDTEIVGDYSDDATGKRCFRRRVGGARQHDERNIVYAEQSHRWAIASCTGQCAAAVHDLSTCTPQHHDRRSQPPRRYSSRRLPSSRSWRSDAVRTDTWPHLWPSSPRCLATVSVHSAQRIKWQCCTASGRVASAVNRCMELRNFTSSQLLLLPLKQQYTMSQKNCRLFSLL